jgi:hypothetical protein
MYVVKVDGKSDNRKLPRKHARQGGAELFLNSLRSVPAECVDCPSSRQNFTAVHHTPRDEVFLSGPHRNSLPADNQRIAALQNSHVFVVIMGMGRRCRRLVAGPKGHLAPIRPIERITLHATGRLAGADYSVRSVFHKLRETVHNRRVYALVLPQLEMEEAFVR